MQRHRDVVPRRAHEVVAEQRLRGEADRVQHAVDPAPLCGHRVADGVDVRRVGDVELEHGISEPSGCAPSLRAVRLVRLSPRPAPVSTRFAPSSLGDPRHAERQRGVREDAGDDDVLAVEETHDTDRSGLIDS